MSASIFQETKNSLHELYLEDKRPWLVGASTPSCGSSRFGCCPKRNMAIRSQDGGESAPPGDFVGYTIVQ